MYHADMADDQFSKLVEDKLGVIGIKMVCTDGAIESIDERNPCEECGDGYKARIGAATWTKEMNCPSGEHILALNTQHLESQGNFW